MPTESDSTATPLVERAEMWLRVNTDRKDFCDLPADIVRDLLGRIAELEAENGMLRAFSEGAWKAIRLLVASPSLKERAEIASELEYLDAD